MKITNQIGSVESTPAMLTVNEISRPGSTQENYARIANLFMEYSTLVSTAVNFLYSNKDLSRYCASTSTAQFDGGPLLGVTFPAPVGVHTLEIFFSSCLQYDVLLQGVNSLSSTASDVSLAWDFANPNLRYHFFVATANNLLRDSKQGEYRINTTANGSVNDSLSSIDPQRGFASSRSTSVVPGGTFTNNVTGNVATFTSGSVTTTRRDQYYDRYDYNDVSFTIGNVNYVVSGFYITEYFPGRQGRNDYINDSRVVTAFVNGVQVAVYIGGLNLPTNIVQVF